MSDRGVTICFLPQTPPSQILTILVEKLKDARLLRVEKECGHVIVGLIGTKKGLDAGIHFF